MKLNRNKMAMLMIAIMVTSVIVAMTSAEISVLDTPPQQPVQVKGDVTYDNGTRVPDGWLVILTDVTEGTELGNDTTEDVISAIPQYEIKVDPSLIVVGHDIKTSVSNGGWSGNETHTVQSGEDAVGHTIMMSDLIVYGEEPTGPTIVSYTISNSTITPPQTTEIDVEFSETVSYTIAIESETSTVYDWTGDATDPQAKIWNGTYKADGTVVPAGTYTVNVTGTNTTTGKYVTDTTKVITVSGDVVYGVDLSADTQEKPVAPNVNATYTLTVKNTGNVVDNFTLSVENVNDATTASLSKEEIVNLEAGLTEDVSLNVCDATEGTFVVNVTATSEKGGADVNDTITTTTTVQVAQLNIADINAEPSTGVNTANPTTVSATITSGAALELVTLYAIDTANYTLYAEDIPIGGDDYSSEWDATEFTVTDATTSSGTKPVFVGKTVKWDTTTYYSVLGNLTINATSGTAVAVALFDKDDLKLSKLIDPLTKESYSVEPGNTTFAPFAVDATDRDSITDIWALLGSLEPLEAVTLTGTEPDYSISLVKTQVLDGDYTVGMAALDKAGAKDYSETTVSVGLTPTPTPTPTPAPRGRGGGGGGGGVPDTDGDGYTDLEEMIMGTDPLDPCDPNPECVACTDAIVEEVITEVITERPATPKPKPKPTIAPTTPEPEPEEPEKKVPGFEVVFAIAGLLAVAYLALRRKK